MSPRSEQVRQEIDQAIADGWRIEEEAPGRVVLVKREFGSLGVHLLVALLTFWWTMGLGNLAYAAYAYATDSRRRVVWDAPDAPTATCPECGTPAPADASYCRHCGTDLPRRADRGVVTCPDCGAVVTEGSTYCSSCGVALAAALEAETEGPS